MSAACYGPKGGAAHVRGGKQVQMRKKKKAPPRGKTAEPGERKALRKRIVLSNGNALEVPDLEELTAAHLLDGDGDGNSSAGRVLALPDGVVDQLRAVEAFKPSQCFSLFRRPSVLVRGETVALATQMQRAATARETLRLVIDGERIAGKSILLLQALAHGFLNDWVVIHVPEGELGLGGVFFVFFSFPFLFCPFFLFSVSFSLPSHSSLFSSPSPLLLSLSR